MKKALIIAVHPDDETIGCGGTMLKLKEMGWEVYWLMLTAAFPGQAWSDEIIKKRREEIVEVAKIYGVSATLNLKYPAATLDQQSLGEVIGKISGILADVKPDWVFLPNRSDVHSDHRVGFEAAWAACKWFRAPSISKVLMFECVSETEYAPPFGEGAFIPTFTSILPAIYRGSWKSWIGINRNSSRPRFHEAEKLWRRLPVTGGAEWALIMPKHS